MESIAPEKKTMWNKNFICIMVTNICLGLASSPVNALVSTYAAFLGAGAVLVGALSGMFYGVAFAMRPITGPVMTKLDKRKLLILSYILGLLANAGYAFTGSIGMFIAFRVINGMQFSLAGPLAMTIASDSLPPEKLGSGLGLYGMMYSLAMAVAPAIGIALKGYGTAVQSEGFGFMLVFLFAALCSAIGLIPCFLIKLPKVKKETLAAAGAWYKNIIAADAIVPAILMMLVCMGFSLYNFYMVPFADAYGIVGIGSFYTVFSVFMVVVRPLSGRLVDKLGVIKLIIVGTAMFGISFVIVANSHSLLMCLLAAAVAAMGYGTAQPAIQTMCIQCVIPLKRAVASNTNFFGTDLGFFCGPLAGGIIYQLVANYSTMFLCMVVPAALAIVILLVSWKGFEKNRKKVLATMQEAAQAKSL